MKRLLQVSTDALPEAANDPGLDETATQKHPGGHIDVIWKRPLLKARHVAQQSLHLIVLGHVGSTHLLRHGLQPVDCTLA